MIAVAQQFRERVGEIRPTQLLHSFGVGSIVELPNLSVMVMGLDFWKMAEARELSEERLLRAVQREISPQVTRLMHPPVAPDQFGAVPVPFEELSRAGVPVSPFPRWMLCTGCRLLAPVESDLFELQANPYRSDRTRYVHKNCPKSPLRSPLVIPARFMVACEKGHLDDFPWVEFVHSGPTDCNALLQFTEMGASGDIAGVQVKCTRCTASRGLVEAFSEAGRAELSTCSRRLPHLRSHDEECDCEQRPLLLGASNGWFSVMLSALTIPSLSGKLGQLVEAHWPHLGKCAGPEFVPFAKGLLPGLSSYPDSEIWDAICQRRSSDGADQEATSLRAPEWRAFSQPDPKLTSDDFRLRGVEPPDAYKPHLERVVLAERLREVSALVGFTRISSPRDLGDPEELPEDRVAPLCRDVPAWVPASEVRGEGIFIQFRESALLEWVGRMAKLDGEFLEAHRRWRTMRNLEPELGYPGLRYVLLHSFSHMLMRQLSLECGYSAASIRERIYSLPPGADGGPMAAVLLYTSAPDSEGTLGGLVSLGEPEVLGAHIIQGLEQMTLCASDPLCAEHRANDDSLALHGAACHACLFAPETSCERGNKYLDRSVLMPTVDRLDLSFFGEQ